MIWVVRSGRKAIFYNEMISSSKVFLPWDGYNYDLSTYKSMDTLKGVVRKEKNTDNRTAISTWASQIMYFIEKMQIGDYVLIPSKWSHEYIFARIIGSYVFDSNQNEGLKHSRSITIVESNIPNSIFEKKVRYSLGAYRTIFSAKHEDEILHSIKKYCHLKSI